MFASGARLSAHRIRTKTRQYPSAVTPVGTTTKTATACIIRNARRPILLPARTPANGGLTSCRSSPHATPRHSPGVCFSSNASREAFSASPGQPEPLANQPVNRLSAANRRIYKNRMNTRRTERTGANSIVSSLTSESQVTLAGSTSYRQKSASARKTGSRTPAGKLEKYARWLENTARKNIIRLEKLQKSMEKSSPNRREGKAQRRRTQRGYSPLRGYPASSLASQASSFAALPPPPAR